MYFICEERGREWWVCDGFLENGFCFGQHICSNPGFAPGDLFYTRVDRKYALKQMFNLKQSSIGDDYQNGLWETFEIRSKADVPQLYHNFITMQEGLKPQYEIYKDLIEKYELQQKTIEGEIVNENDQRTT